MEKMCVVSFILSGNLLLLGLHPFWVAANTSNQMQLINKPAVSSIQSPDGDIIDCVLLYQQHALDHPHLKNHTIQMEPNIYPNGYNLTQNARWTQMWHEGGKCPIGTIPIRRVMEADLFRAKSIKDYGKKHQRPSYSETKIQTSYSNHEYAVVHVEEGIYDGSIATLNVWNPSVEDDKEFSLAQLWLTSGSYVDSSLNTVEAGWHVYPIFYGDRRTRLFIYWTSDAYISTGCYNLLCSGFVQVSTEITLGGSLYPTSTFGQQAQNLQILIWLDQSEGNWWMQLDGQHLVGYWPSSLFKNLRYGATMMEWGGEILNLKANGRHTTTQMGSGHFPSEGFGNSAYFSNLQIIDNSNRFDAPSNPQIIVGNPNCYNSILGYNSNWQNYFYFGGPGYDPIKCP